MWVFCFLGWEMKRVRVSKDSDVSLGICGAGSGFFLRSTGGKRECGHPWAGYPNGIVPLGTIVRG